MTIALQTISCYAAVAQDTGECPVVSTVAGS
jgi:hypothetical protein